MRALLVIGSAVFLWGQRQRAMYPAMNLKLIVAILVIAAMLPVLGPSWRGDRIEWMLARGFHAWFFNEIKEDRMAWPGPTLPAQMKVDAKTNLVG
jgi:hypothetical protein